MEIIKKETEQFLRALGPELISGISNSGDPISLVYKIDNRRALIEVIPAPDSMNKWDAIIDCYELPRHRFSFKSPKHKSSERVQLDFGTKPHKAIASIKDGVNTALKQFSQEMLKSLAMSKEPLTLSYNDKQIEVMFFSENNKVQYSISID